MCCVTLSYFPLKLVKAFVIFFSLGLIVRLQHCYALMKGCAGFSMYWAVKAKEMLIWVSYGKYLPQNLSELAFYFGLALGSLLAFLFFLGILLTTKTRHCIITCPYGIFTFGIFVTYYILGVLCLTAGFYGAEAFSDYCKNQDQDYWDGFKLQTFVKEIDNTYQELDYQLMCTDICPCGPIDKYTFRDYTFKGKNFTGTNYNVNSCLTANDFSSKWDYDLIWYLKQLEETYKCTGLCKAQTLHLFTNYSSGPNYEACYYKIGYELERDLGKMGYVFLSCGTFVFCAWFCSFGLCFRDKQAKTLREHMRKKKYLMDKVKKGEGTHSFNTRDDFNQTHLDQQAIVEGVPDSSITPNHNITKNM